MNRGRLAVIALLAVGAIAIAAQSFATPTIRVSAGEDLQEAIASAPRGSTVELVGTHRGPITIDRRIALVGAPGATVVAPLDALAALRVDADGATVANLTVEGGWTGIELNDADRSEVRDVSIRGSDLQGLLVYKGSATVERVDIRNLRDPHAQGIEVLSAPDVVVRGSSVHGGKVGIVAHLSEVFFEDNYVTGTSHAGVMIREMSAGAAHDNRVEDARGAGLYCGDESRCEFAGNTVEDISSIGTARSSAGWGLVVNYRSAASSTEDDLNGETGSVLSLSNSRIREASPLDLGDGSTALFPATIATVLSLIALGLVYVMVRRFLPVKSDRPRHPMMNALGHALLWTGLAVQSFHMLEHVVQLSRVRFDGVPSRGSLVGSLVDTEWVHFVYNALVLAGLVALVAFRRRGWNPPGRRILGDRMIVAAAVFQGYHLVEHTFKVVQHETSGAKVNPGILGETFDLVLLHFGVNLAVYLAFVLATAAYTRRRGRRRAIAEPGDMGAGDLGVEPV